MHFITPKTNCTHIKDNINVEFSNNIKKLPSNCNNCKEHFENWICLKCYNVFCSRYKNKHMVQHNFASNHCIVLSLVDFSTWCYECDSYVTNDNIQTIMKNIYNAKYN